MSESEAMPAASSPAMPCVRECGRPEPERRHTAGDAQIPFPSTAHILVKAALAFCVVQLLIALALVEMFEGAAAFGGAVLLAALAALLSSPAGVLWAIRPYAAERRANEAQLADMRRLLRQEIDARMAAEERLRTREQELELQIGEIEYVKQLVEQQAADTVGLAEDLAAQKQAIEESSRQTEYLAHHDPLTGLPNRRHFEDTLRRRMEAAQAAGAALTLIYIDLDNFKKVNDNLGHERGDELLVDVAKRLRAVLRDDDFVARLGGDEFAVLLSGNGANGDPDPKRLPQRIRRALQIPVAGAKGAIPVSATLGVASLPDDAADEQALLRCADRAMYAAKARGRNCVAFHRELSGVPTNA
jgi:diguanylate cyclase (GGDEF)-like protein